MLFSLPVGSPMKNPSYSWHPSEYRQPVWVLLVPTQVIDIFLTNFRHSCCLYSILWAFYSMVIFSSGLCIFAFATQLGYSFCTFSPAFIYRLHQVMCLCFWVINYRFSSWKDNVFLLMLHLALKVIYCWRLMFQPVALVIWDWFYAAI